MRLKMCCEDLANMQEGSHTIYIKENNNKVVFELTHEGYNPVEIYYCPFCATKLDVFKLDLCTVCESPKKRCKCGGYE